jgi:hypothetical protein
LELLEEDLKELNHALARVGASEVQVFVRVTHVIIKLKLALGVSKWEWWW